MTAPLHERLAEAAKGAGGERWIAASYSPKTIGVGAPGGPAYMLVRPNHGDMDSLWPLIEHIRAADPESVAKLCEQVRVLLGAVQAVEDFISGKPDAPEPFGMTRDALRLVKGES